MEKPQINKLSEIVNNLNIFKSWDFETKTTLTGTLNGITLKMLTEQENNIDDFSEYTVCFCIKTNCLVVSYSINSRESNTIPVVNRFYEPLLFQVITNMKFL